MKEKPILFSGPMVHLIYPERLLFGSMPAMRNLRPELTGIAPWTHGEWALILVYTITGVKRGRPCKTKN